MLYSQVNMLQISLTRFNNFRDRLPAESSPPRKYAEQYRTIQEFEQLRTYLKQVGDRVMPPGEGVRTFRETVSGIEGQTLQASGVASGRYLLRLNVEREGVQCRYQATKGKQSWTLTGPQGSTTYTLAGDTLKVT